MLLETYCNLLLLAVGVDWRFCTPLAMMQNSDASSYASRLHCIFFLCKLLFLLSSSSAFPNAHVPAVPGSLLSAPRVLFLQRVPRSCRLLIVVNSPVCGDLCCFAKSTTQSQNTVRESRLIIVTTPTHSRAQCALCSFFFSSKCYIVIHRERLGVVNCCQLSSFKFPVFTSMCSAHLSHFGTFCTFCPFCTVFCAFLQSAMKSNTGKGS